GERRYSDLSALYTRFNEELIRVIDNRPLREITDRLFYQTHRVWLQLLPEMDWDEEAGCVVDEFSEVLSALRARDMGRVAQVRRLAAAAHAAPLIAPDQQVHSCPPRPRCWGGCPM
ncbi:MAG: hypothetical protein L0K86_10085, partial [Actinomycetia bacterium]|nr:hypothetical protein [Actinomycetes bacterium]